MPYANVNLEGRLVNDPEIKVSHVVFSFHIYFNLFQC